MSPRLRLTVPVKESCLKLLESEPGSREDGSDRLQTEAASIELALRKRRLRVVRIIDRLNVGGPARHVVWLTAGLDPELFDTVLITGTVPESEGDMTYFAEAEGVRPLVLEEMSRELSPLDAI